MYFHCTENALKEINHNLSQSNKGEQKNVYVWIVELRIMVDYKLLFFMNSFCGAFVVFRYEIDDSIIIEKSPLAKAFKAVYKDLEISEELFEKYLNV